MFTLFPPKKQRSFSFFFFPLFLRPILPANELPAGNRWHEVSVTGTTPEDNLRVLIVVTPRPSKRQRRSSQNKADALELVSGK